MEQGNGQITPRMLLDRIDRLEQRMAEQFAELRRDLSVIPPRCADHDARLKQVEAASQARTWESRLYGLVATLAAALGIKGVTQ